MKEKYSLDATQCVTVQFNPRLVFSVDGPSLVMPSHRQQGGPRTCDALEVDGVSATSRGRVWENSRGSSREKISVWAFFVCCEV